MGLFQEEREVVYLFSPEPFAAALALGWLLMTNLKITKYQKVKFARLPLINDVVT